MKLDHDGPCQTFMEAMAKIRESLPPNAFDDAFCDRCGRLTTRCDGHEVEDLEAEIAKFRALVLEYITTPAFVGDQRIERTRERCHELETLLMDWAEGRQ
jgi:hypothetical protein